MTKNQGMRDNSVMMSSEMPSAKKSCSGSPDMLSNGSTAIEGLSGNGSGSIAPLIGAGAPRPSIAHRHTRTGLAMFFSC